MPTSFSFSSNGLVTPSYVTLSSLTPGSASGVNDTSDASAIAPSQTIDTGGDVDVFAVTLIAGQTYSFDIDDGAGDSSGGSVDLELDLIDQEGNLVLSDDGITSTDNGSFSLADPGVTVQANQSGTYYIAVHAQDAEYIDGAFRFDSGGSTDTGDYSLVFSTEDLPPATQLGSGNDSRSFTSGADHVLGGAGADRLDLFEGQDVADGQSGNDLLYGGSGDDEVTGRGGRDSLFGDNGDDTLIGGDDDDAMRGGSDDDALSGGEGADLLKGGDDSDILWGESGADSLIGGGGDDFLRGGNGVDRLEGDGGADTFHFLPGESNFDAGGFDEDRIVDLESQDTIDLSDLVLGSLTFRGTGSFTGSNQVRIVDYRDDFGNGFQEVRVNLDGDTGDTELAFLVDTSGNFTLQSGDFIL